MSIGTQKKNDTDHASSVTNNASTIGSLNGDLTIKAGDTLHVTGSDLIAGKNLTGTAANVVIDSATDTSNKTHSETTSSSGVTLGLSGSIGDAINGAYQQAQAAKSGAGDSRATALHAIAAAGDAAIGVASVTGGALAGKGTPSIGVQVSVGSSHSRLDTSENQTTQRGSSVTAGGTTSLIATGNGTPGSGNITVAGSNVSGNDVLLAAKNQIDLQNTTNTDSTRSSNSSSSASVGVSIGSNGIGVSASMSRAHGDGNSDAAMQNNSHVTGANSVTLVSGGDTNVIGSNVNGGTVTASVGGNLNRDTSNLNGTVSKTPDVQNLLDKQADVMNAAQAAGQVVAQGIGSYADMKHAEAQRAADAAGLAGDKTAQAAYQAEADSWDEGGTNRVYLHIAGGALIGGLGGGGVGSAAQGAAGAGLAALLADQTAQAAKEVAGATDSTLAGKVSGNLLVGALGWLVGGTAGAATASNVNLYNQWNHTDTDTLEEASGQGTSRKKTTALDLVLQSIANGLNAVIGIGGGKPPTASPGLVLVGEAGAGGKTLQPGGAGLGLDTATLAKNGQSSGAGDSNTPMLGADGAQFASKTIWKGDGKERIDVENPNPGQRPGQIHYQDNQGNKYLYDPSTNSFPDAPNSVNKLLNDPSFNSAIQKGLNKYLGGK
ncbi:hypothetical protein EMIT0111MI5_250002 [Burkholderia sp. IT-111MI5]